MLDDREHGMMHEPFVFGMEQLLDRFAETMPHAHDGFQMYLSDKKMPDIRGLPTGSAGVLIRKEADAGGYWYYSSYFDLRGWMGNGGLTRYFSEPPSIIYYYGAPRPHKS